MHRPTLSEEELSPSQWKSNASVWCSCSLHFVIQLADRNYKNIRIQKQSGATHTTPSLHNGPEIALLQYVIHAEIFPSKQRLWYQLLSFSPAKGILAETSRKVQVGLAGCISNRCLWGRRYKVMLDTCCYAYKLRQASQETKLGLVSARQYQMLDRK